MQPVSWLKLKHRLKKGWKKTTHSGGGDSGPRSEKDRLLKKRREYERDQRPKHVPKADYYRKSR